MYIVCAYCQNPIADRPPKDSTDVSHGICDTCMNLVLADDGTTLQSLIEGIGAPVLVIDNNGVALTANSRAQSALGKSIATIRGYRGGEVIECEHARKPGGCGQQGECKACVIRNSVMQTHATGEPVARAVAEQTVMVKNPDGSESRVKQRFVISTRTYHGLVLLRVDDVS